jgi:hypothetical protein
LQILVGADPQQKLSSDTELTRRHDSNVPKIVLRAEKTDTDQRQLSVYDHEGGIRIDGWDYGDTVERLKGGREYEWMIDVAANDLPALVAALGGAAGDDVFEAIRAFNDPNALQRIIIDGIPHKWWSWVSSD